MLVIFYEVFVMKDKKYINDGIKSSYMPKVQEKGIASSYMEPMLNSIPDESQTETQSTNQSELLEEREIQEKK